MHFSCLDLNETDVSLIHSLLMINPTVHFPKRKKKTMDEATTKTKASETFGRKQFKKNYPKKQENKLFNLTDARMIEAWAVYQEFG